MSPSPRSPSSIFTYSLCFESAHCNFVQTCSHTWMKTLSRTYFTSSLSNTSARSHTPVWSQLGPSAPANQQSVLQRGTQTPLKHMSPWKHLKIRCFPSPALRPAGTCKAHRITSEGNRGGREERGRKNSSSMRKFYCTPPPLLSRSVHHPPRPPPAGQSAREPDWDETSAPLRETPHLSEQVGCCCRTKLCWERGS